MARDLRDVVNKILVPVGDDDATPEEIAGLASDLAAFFDASVTLLYLGRFPLWVPAGGGQPAAPQMSAALMNAIEENGRTLLRRMARVMTANGIEVSSQLVLGGRPVRRILEEEKADLVVLPRWGTGVSKRLSRVVTPSILEDATCPVLVLKGNRWLTESQATRPSRSDKPSASS